MPSMAPVPPQPNLLRAGFIGILVALVIGYIAAKLAGVA